MKKRRKSAALVDSVDRMFGYFALVVLLCAFTIMSLGAFLYLLAGALVIAALARISRRQRIRKERYRMAEIVARRKELLGASRLKRCKNHKAKLKHYEPNLMPLGLRKAVKTGNPFPEAHLRSLSQVNRMESNERGTSGQGRVMP